MRFTRLAPALLCVALGGCTSLAREDVGGADGLTLDYGSIDLPTLSVEMVESLISSPEFSRYRGSAVGEDMRVVLYIGEPVNHTSRWLDAEGIQDSIRSALLRSGRFRLVTGTGDQLVADMTLCGALYSTEAGGRMLYMYRLRCTDNATAEVFPGGWAVLLDAGRAHLYKRFGQVEVRPVRASDLPAADQASLTP